MSDKTKKYKIKSGINFRRNSDNDLVVLNNSSDKLIRYTLGSADIVEGLLMGKSIGEIHDLMLKQYNVEESLLAIDINKSVEMASERGLIE